MAFKLFPDLIHYNINTYNVIIYNLYRIITSTKTIQLYYNIRVFLETKISIVPKHPYIMVKM